jgi:lipid-A-disaccharide synthase
VPDRRVIFVTAADVSGDGHAAGLIAALRRRLPRAAFVGVGGQRMAAAGCMLLERPAERSAMLTSTFRQLSYYRRLIKLVGQAMRERRPAVHVPVDSPALNWHFCQAARRCGVPVMYYIAPQVWAWAPWRVRKLRKLTDAVACILPFEQEYLRRRGVNAHFVGHPLFDGLPEPELPDLDEAARSGAWRIALLAGSRRGEIQAHAAALAQATTDLRAELPKAEFTFIASDAPTGGMIRQALGVRDLPISVGQASAVLSRSHFALAKSGTVGLQAAHFGVPMLVFYRVGYLAYNLLGRWLLRTRYVALVNILAGRELVPELVPWHGQANRLTRQALKMLADVEGLKRLRRELLELVKPLRIAPPGSAADNAAELVLSVMREAKE